MLIGKTKLEWAGNRTRTKSKRCLRKQSVTCQIHVNTKPQPLHPSETIWLMVITIIQILDQRHILVTVSAGRYSHMTISIDMYWHVLGALCASVKVLNYRQSLVSRKYKINYYIYLPHDKKMNLNTTILHHLGVIECEFRTFSLTFIVERTPSPMHKWIIYSVIIILFNQFFVFECCLNSKQYSNQKSKDG